MPEALAAHIGAQVARALHAAHTACGRDGKPLHLVHRDISPDNVLLSRSGGVCLGDFGVARARGTAEVQDPAAGAKGKLGYIAPEQARGDPVGPPADVFSLGRVVAEGADVRCRHALRKVLDKATAADARQRFQTAAELGAALVRVCPTPPDPEGALSQWLHRVAPEALDHRRTTPDAAPAVRTEAPLAGVPLASASLERGGAASQALFAELAPPRRRALKIAAALGALLALSLPAAWIVEASRSARLAAPGGIPRDGRRAPCLQPARGCGGVRRRSIAGDDAAHRRARRRPARGARRQPAPVQMARGRRAHVRRLVGPAGLRSHAVKGKEIAAEARRSGF